MRGIGALKRTLTLPLSLEGRGDLFVRRSVPRPAACEHVAHRATATKIETDIAAIFASAIDFLLGT